jgi:heme/copper-type cytochrome/quinol oxidase subunit 3
MKAMEQIQSVPESRRQRPDNRKLGMWLFLASEVMLFSSLIGSFLNMKWRSPAGANHVLNIPITALNTFILIVSSTAVVMALAAIQDGDRKKLRNLLIATWFLGVTFLGIQINEYRVLFGKGLSPSSSLFGSGFYALTGLHGLHVLIGVLWLSGLIVLTLRGRLAATRAILVEVFGLYWHFVDVVWIILFTIVYLL